MSLPPAPAPRTEPLTPRKALPPLQVSWSPWQPGLFHKQKVLAPWEWEDEDISRDKVLVYSTLV